MRGSTTLLEVTIPLRSHDEARLVLGPYDRHAKLLRQALDVEIYTRNGNVRLKGRDGDVVAARERVEHLLGKHRKGRELEPAQVEEILVGQPAQRASAADKRRERAAHPPDEGRGRSVERGGAAAGFGRGRVDMPVSPKQLRARAVEPRGANQRRYLEAIEESTLVFGVGPAGTGKTYLAVAMAVRALRSGEVRRLVITRPVVEAGENLGFLPGDLQQKLNPYLRPVYDALNDQLGFEDVNMLEEAGVIEIAPLAYMRGRTLAHSFVLLDEAQNTSVAQMKMFLTRLGEGSRMVVTGDPGQSDLDGGRKSGLLDAVSRLRGFAGVGVVEFTGADVVRHPLVEQIVRAYEGGGRGDA